jgi:hypothetical protein
MRQLCEDVEMRCTVQQQHCFLGQCSFFQGIPNFWSKLFIEPIFKIFFIPSCSLLAITTNVKAGCVSVSKQLSFWHYQLQSFILYFTHAFAQHMTIRYFLDDLGQTILPFFSKEGGSLDLSKGILTTEIIHLVRFQTSSSMKLYRKGICHSSTGAKSFTVNIIR